jgi:hypothetical protein
VDQTCVLYPKMLELPNSDEQVSLYRLGRVSELHGTANLVSVNTIQKEPSMVDIKKLLLVAVVLAAAIAGCSGQDEPLSILDPTQGAGSSTSLGDAATATASIVLSGFSVQFDGRQVSGGNTTFSYTVTGTGGEHALSHFALEVPDCAPAVLSTSPAGGTIGVNPLTGLYSVKWDLSLGTNESRSYSVTFTGDVPLGIIRASVKASTEVGLAEIAGPCGGFEISGNVYIDADSNGVLNGADEPGIENVTVTLEDGNGGIETYTTDASGTFSFLRLSGTFTLRVDAATSVVDFNEELAESFDPSGPTSVIVTVGPDSPGNNFGYKPQVAEIIVELDTGVLLTDGEPIKFWKRELRSAINGGNGKSEFDPTAMGIFIEKIQMLFLPDPFTFTPGNELQEALDILNDKSKDPVMQLKRELLAAEFNEVSDKGLVGADDLQRALLSWAESLVAQLSAGPSASSRYGDGPVRVISKFDVEDATLLLNKLNGATGGGSGGEG